MLPGMGGRCVPAIRDHPALRSSSDRHPAIAWLANRLADVPSVERVVLFGSRARGDHGSRPDIDLAVEAPGATLANRARMAELVEDTPALVGIDVVRLDQADAALRQAIDAKGIVLHERSRAAPVMARP